MLEGEAMSSFEQEVTSPEGQGGRLTSSAERGGGVTSPEGCNDILSRIWGWSKLDIRDSTCGLQGIPLILCLECCLHGHLIGLWPKHGVRGHPMRLLCNLSWNSAYTVSPNQKLLWGAMPWSGPEWHQSSPATSGPPGSAGCRPVSTSIILESKVILQDSEGRCECRLEVYLHTIPRRRAKIVNMVKSKWDVIPLQEITHALIYTCSSSLEQPIILEKPLGWVEKHTKQQNWNSLPAVNELLSLVASRWI